MRRALLISLFSLALTTRAELEFEINQEDQVKKKTRTGTLNGADEAKINELWKGLAASAEQTDHYRAITLLGLLKSHGSSKKRPEYIYYLALMLFNLDETSNAVQKATKSKAYTLFLKYCDSCQGTQNYRIWAPRALARAAYCAYYFMNLRNEGVELKSRLSSEFAGFKPSVIEQKLLRKIK